MKELRMGIAGLGSISENAFVLAAKETGGIKICALLGRSCEKAEAFYNRCLAKYGKEMFDNTEFFDNEDEFFSSGMDAVFIGTPNYLHMPYSVKALENGIHVLCEKPEAMTREEILKVKETAEKSGCVYAVVRNNRYLGSTAVLKELVEKGEFGNFYCGRCGWIRHRGVPGGWFSKKEFSGGGPIIDLGVHIIDLAMYFMGNPKPVSVSASAYNGICKKSEEYSVEDEMTGFIRFDNGASLQIDFMWAANTEDRDKSFIELHGDKAGLVWESGKAKIIKSADNKPVVTEIEPKIQRSGHIDNVIDFVNAINNGTPTRVSMEESVNMITLLEAIYKSADLGREIML